MSALHRAVVALLISGGISPVLGCGYCVEDKIAAVYDHAIIERAMIANHTIAFCLIDGGFVADNTLQREIEDSLESAPGVDHGTARVSLENASLSFAFDAARASLDAILRAANQLLVAKGVKLLPLRVMDRPAELKVISGR